MLAPRSARDCGRGRSLLKEVVVTQGVRTFGLMSHLTDAYPAGQERTRVPHSLEALIPTVTLLEHVLLAQGFMGVSKVSFPRRLQLQNRDSTGANLSNAIKCRCRSYVGEESTHWPRLLSSFSNPILKKE